MTIDEAIKNMEESAETFKRLQEKRPDIRGFEETKLEYEQLAEWLKELKQLREQTRWIPTSERYPKIEDEYKYFLVTDDKGEVSVQEFFISLDEEPQPYFSGMVNVIAWMPKPKSYSGVKE